MKTLIAATGIVFVLCPVASSFAAENMFAWAGRRYQTCMSEVARNVPRPVLQKNLAAFENSCRLRAWDPKSGLRY